MAPKKVTTESNIETAKPAKTKKVTPKKAKVKPEPVDDGPKKRNMTAVSTDFVSSVQASLSEELSAKLKVKDVKEICEAFVKTLVEKVQAGDTVSFTNNMTFKRQVRSARTYKNLKTGDPIKKPSHYVMSMQVKPALKKTSSDDSNR